MMTKKEFKKENNNSWHSIGNFLIKKNHTCFGSEGPVIQVKSHYEKYGQHHVINEVYVLEKHNIKVIPERSANKIIKFWEKCNQIGFFTPVPGRHPCFREDNVTPKVKIKNEDRQNALFRMINKSGDQRFEIYLCPSCQSFHMGRNPNVHHSRLLTEKINEK